MNQLASILVPTALTLLTFSCQKSDDTISGSACLKILDGWDISVSRLPEIIVQSDVYFINEEIGYTVGNGGKITKTTNGGQNWEITSSLTNARLFTVFFVNEQVGYVSGDGEKNVQGELSNAVLLKTLDGGTSWEKQFIDGIDWIRSLKFTDENNGFGIFTYPEENDRRRSKLLSTHNGGVTWEPTLIPDSMYRIHGYQFYQNIFDAWGIDNSYNWKYLRSYDHGFTWQEILLPSTECNLIYPISEEFGFMSSEGVVYKTSDIGNTWIALPNSPLLEAKLTHFSSPNNGFAIVPVYVLKTDGHQEWKELNSFDVYQTTDGGITWDTSVISSKCDFTGNVFNFSNEVIYTVGEEDVVNKFKMK